MNQFQRAALPLTRAAPWYSGQMGVDGSDVSRGLRTQSGGIVIYVDDNHPGASAVGDGTNPEEPLSTMEEAVDELIRQAAANSTSYDGSVIVVGGQATIAETIIIPPTAPENCTILGAGNGINQPTWAAATAAGTALTIRQQGWVIDGFRFVTGAAGTAIRLQWIPGSSYVANRTLIQNNFFDGAWAGLYGINLDGAPFDTYILNNEFREYRRGDNSAFALITTTSSEANAYMNVVQGNLFFENENHVGSLGDNRGFNASIFQHNTFREGVLIANTRQLDLRGGSQGRNTVNWNSFGGDYSNTGGYWANAANPGNWVGNTAEDVAEAEVADNGLTVAVPAA